MNGVRLTSEEGATPRFESGRVCREDGCATRLSIYNDSPYCSVHTPMVTPRTRGRRAAS